MQGLAAELHTLFTGQTLVRLDRVDSTNNYLAEMVRSVTLPEGFLVLAREQFAGRGQRGAKWAAEAGASLTMSLLYTPVFLKPEQQFYLSKAVALGVADAVQCFTNGRVQVKWPNDVLLNGRKICGILIENQVGASRKWHSVIGVGLNVNQSVFELGLKNATSLLRETGKPCNVETVTARVCEFIEANYLKLRANITALDARYRELLYGTDEDLRYETDDERFTGRVVDVDERGRLLLQPESGTVQAFDLKEIRVLPRKR